MDLTITFAITFQSRRFSDWSSLIYLYRILLSSRIYMESSWGSNYDTCRRKNKVQVRWKWNMMMKKVPWENRNMIITFSEVLIDTEFKSLSDLLTRNSFKLILNSKWDCKQTSQTSYCSVLIMVINCVYLNIQIANVCK